MHKLFSNIIIYNFFNINNFFEIFDLRSVYIYFISFEQVYNHQLDYFLHYSFYVLVQTLMICFINQVYFIHDYLLQ